MGISALDDMMTLPAARLHGRPGLVRAIHNLPTNLRSLTALKQNLFKELKTSRHVVTPADSPWCM